MTTHRILAFLLLLSVVALFITTTHTGGAAQDVGLGGDSEDPESVIPRDKRPDGPWNIKDCETRERKRKKAAGEIRRQKEKAASAGIASPDNQPEWERWELSTILGSGKEGESKDGTSAAKTRFAYPADVVVDAKGRVVVADTNNRKVRVWDPETDSLGTLFGNGQSRPMPYTSKVPLGKATETWFEATYALWLDQDGGVLADYLVRSGVAGLTEDGELEWKFVLLYGDPGTSYPVDDAVYKTLLARERHNVWDIAYSPDGTMYIADAETRQVLRVDPETRKTEVVAGNGKQGYAGDNGPAVDASFYSVGDIAFDSKGDLYIADSNDSRIRKVSMETGLITTYAGTGERDYDGDGGHRLKAKFDRPREMVWHPNGKLYVLDNAAHCVRVIDPADDVVETVIGQGYPGYEGDGKPLYESLLDSPCGMCVDAAGDLYIADSCNHCIRKLTPKLAPVAPVTPGPAD